MVPILRPSENLRQKRRDRDFRLVTIFLIFCFLDPNFAEGHKIRTLGSRDPFFVVEMSNSLDPNFSKGHKIRTLGSRDIIFFFK